MKGKGMSHDTRAEAERRIQQGDEFPSMIARDLGVQTNTIRLLRRKMRKAGRLPEQ